MTPAELERLADDYDRLAAEQEAERTPAYEAMAATSRRCARSLRLEAQTGKLHCVCCLKPDGWHTRK